MERHYRVGARTSPLALKQVGEALAGLRSFYPGFKAEIAGIDTRGDRDRLSSLLKMEGSDFFTGEIDDALLEGAIDFAVHSAKDLPDIMDKGLQLAAVTGSVDPFDALVSKSGLVLDELPRGARVGTSSRRRRQGLEEYRSDLRLVDIRGNIGERLRLLDRDALDAVVTASAALIRLGWEDKIAQRIPFNIIEPHPLQGSLALVARRDDPELAGILSVLDARGK